MALCNSDRLAWFSLRDSDSVAWGMAAAACEYLRDWRSVVEAICCFVCVFWAMETLEGVVVFVECDLAAIDRGRGLREERRLEIDCFCARDTANFACFARLRGAIVKRLYVDRLKVDGTAQVFVFFRGAMVGPSARS